MLIIYYALLYAYARLYFHDFSCMIYLQVAKEGGSKHASVMTIK